MIKGKNKKISSSSDPMKVTAVLAFLFLAAIIVFPLLSKPKQKSVVSQLVSVTQPVVHRPLAAGSQKAHFQQQASLGPRLYSGPGRIAIIIDDWGYSVKNCHFLKEIPQPLAVSILPGLRHTRDVARCAASYNKLTMLHLPLEALHNNDFYPPNYIIRTTMPFGLAEKILDDDLNQLPSIQGVNNHMGSKATGDIFLMKIIFNRLKSKGLFFVDSMTSHHSICETLADSMDLAFGKRDIFLDNINTKPAIIEQLTILAQIAQRRGFAVAIGHDRHLTMQVLKEQIPWLESQGLKIVSIRELLKNP